MTIQTLSYSTATTTTTPKASLIKRNGQVSYRLLERMTESAYRQHEARLRNNFYI
ncbi:hypothetical protein MKP05_19935 [Halomonas sp. EGI 63088]|uniref:Uncharacterized protein n=1 Tax=Halomonas flagellata TaxID=2920385 RepID=A0ABS9RZU9_9GAMM|nr:hypothetical protein [Halomonas flagellata]MCH4565374.1 hypothetical protein [Halomonas flagellata]